MGYLVDADALSQRVMKSREQTADRMIPVGAVLKMIREQSRMGFWILHDVSCP